MNNHIDILKKQEYVLQHGDYHVGNFIYMPNKMLGIIDFNRMSKELAYEEFYKMQLFDRDISIPFAVGKIDGYFKHQIPTLSWDSLKYYCAYACIAGVAWAMDFSEEDIRLAKQQYEKIFIDYRDFNEEIPLWCQEYTHKEELWKNIK